jgi:hypothetical protein
VLVVESTKSGSLATLDPSVRLFDLLVVLPAVEVVPRTDVGYGFLEFLFSVEVECPDTFIVSRKEFQEELGDEMLVFVLNHLSIATD